VTVIGSDYTTRCNRVRDLASTAILGDTMRVPGSLIVVLLALAVGFAAVPAARAAGGVTSEELVSKALNSYDWQCSFYQTSWSCGSWPLSVVFEPEGGEVTHLITFSDEDETDGMGDAGRAMFIDFVDTVCRDPEPVSNFVASVGALMRPGTVPAADVARCHLTGGYVDTTCEFGCYWVDAVVREPPPTPTPTPVLATPSPRVTPTPSPTLAPPTPTLPSVPTPSLTSDGVSTPTPGETGTPAASPTPAVTATPSPSQEQELAGGNPAPLASPPAQAPAPASGAGRFARSVPSLADVSGDPVTLASSALLAVLLLLFIAFPGELFNDTVEGNFDEISGWFRRGPLPRIGRALTRLGHGPVGIAAFVSLAALLNSLLDPELGLDAQSLATYLGFLIALVVTLTAFDLPPLLLRLRRTGELGRIRVLPWTLLIIAAFVAVSRVASLQPGYLYGIVLGLVFVREVGPRDEGREQAAGAVWTLAIALGAWLALGWLRSSAGMLTGFGSTAAETALAGVMVAGIEAVALGLVPFRFLPGAAIYQWNRLVWAAIFGVGIFAFAHVLIGPNLGYLSELSLPGLGAAAAAFVAFGAISVLVWGYFRFRPERASATASEG
jgi:hypothetical protein